MPAPPRKPRRVAGDRDHRAVGEADVGEGARQPHGIGVIGARENPGRRAGFHHLAGIQHRHVGAELRNFQPLKVKRLRLTTHISSSKITSYDSGFLSWPSASVTNDTVDA